MAVMQNMTCRRS